MKVLTVVGRGDRLETFKSFLNGLLPDGAKIKAVIPLKKDSDMGKFLAYVEADLYNDDALDDLCESLQNKLMLVDIHNTQDEAMDFGSMQYGEEAYSDFMGGPTARELKERDIFVALMAAGEILAMRCLVNGEQAIALVHVASGDDPDDQFVTPYAIMINDDLLEKLELPFTTG